MRTTTANAVNAGAVVNAFVSARATIAITGKKVCFTAVTGILVAIA